MQVSSVNFTNFLDFIFGGFLQFGPAVTAAASVVRGLAAAEAGGAVVAQCSYSYDCSIQKLVFGAAVWRRHLVPLRLCEKHLKAVY